MEQNPLLSLLNLPIITPIHLKSLQMRMWGRDLQFSCEAGLVQFLLRFTDCREIRWQIYTHLQDDSNPAFPPTEMVNIKIGRNQHRSPLHLLTEHFGLSLVYGALQIQHGETVINLGTE